MGPTPDKESPTPNLILIESSLPGQELLGELDRLAECCDAGTKVVVVGHYNDVLLYRELLKRGVSEYLVAPVTPLQLMESISNLYNDPESDPVGNVIAFVGAKGGVGSSTICHNLAWSISQKIGEQCVIVDLDLPFGTLGLDFNQDPPQGVADAIFAPDLLDQALVDRLLSRCSENLSLLAAPAAGLSQRVYNIAGMTTTPEEIAAAIRRRLPDAVLDFEPDDAVDRVLASWPGAIDDSTARRDWHWRPEWDLERMADDFLATVTANAEATR